MLGPRIGHLDVGGGPRGDGLDANAEFFLGTNVTAADFPPVEIISSDPVKIRLPRNKLAAPDLPHALGRRLILQLRPEGPNGAAKL